MGSSVLAAGKEQTIQQASGQPPGRHRGLLARASLKPPSEKLTELGQLELIRSSLIGLSCVLILVAEEGKAPQLAVALA